MRPPAPAGESDPDRAAGAAAPLDPPGPPGTAPRRWRDLAILLPVFGTLLLMPPIVALTVPGGMLWGIPAIVLYLFGVWALLIVTAALTAAALRSAPEDDA
ncbi:hypothetical protein [Roseospira navarrensis]|uniref:Uncharacterized protein n=1 Tax=Roseospira navarrensis TaxID=140058 RepID=A0A7X1ZFX6_9PROT|nr:hypothetical protein [Roseospira navarrensis]MQX36510.1 hypothetical protein [Roseospira navarrensis]